MSREKTVYKSNDELAHQWARRELACDATAHIRSAGGSMSAQNRIIYSYRTPIAHIVDTGNPALPRVVLITSQKYSMTTSSKHMPAVHRAVRHLTSFRVPLIGAPGGWNTPDSTNMAEVHAGNLFYAEKQLEKALGKAYRARQEWYGYSSIEGIGADARNYAKAFGLPAPEWADAITIGNRIDDVKIRRAARDAKNNTPEMQARREKARAARAARQQLMELRKKEERATKAKEFVKRWRAGENIYMGASLMHGLRPMIRRDSNGNFETSHGARVPYAAGVEALKFIMERYRELQHMTASAEYRPTIPVSVGDFKLIAVTHTTVQIGCHFFAIEEIERAYNEYAAI